MFASLLNQSPRSALEALSMKYRAISLQKAIISNEEKGFMVNSGASTDPKELGKGAWTERTQMAEIGRKPTIFYMSGL